MKKYLLFLIVNFMLLRTAFCADINQDLKVSTDNLNFGRAATEKQLYLTNKGANALFWSAKSNAPWLKVEPALGKIENPNFIPANAPYYFSNMWPKLPQPWYFMSLGSVGVDHSGNVYIVDGRARRVNKFNKYGEFLFEVGSNVSTTDDNYYLIAASHIAFDSEDNFYVTLSAVAKVKKFDKNGNFLATMTKQGACYDDIAIDSKGNIYVTDTYNMCVDKFDSEGNYLKSWGKQGSGDGEFENSSRVLGIVIDSKDNIYVADNHYNRIQKFDSEGNLIKKWGRAEYIGDWQLGEVFAIDANDIIYICHEHSNQIYKFDTELNPLPTEWKDKRRWEPVSDFYMNDAAVAEDGSIYLGGMYPEVIKFDAKGNELAVWKSYDLEDGMFYGGDYRCREYHGPKAIDIDKTGKVYVSDDTNRLQIFDSNGQFITKRDCKNYPQGFYFSNYRIISIDSNNNVYLAGYTGVDLVGSIIKLDAQGNLLGNWENADFYHTKGLAIDSKGNIYVLLDVDEDYSDFFLLKLDATGNIIGRWDKNMLPNKNFDIYAIAVDSYDNVYIANNLKILKFNSDGSLTGGWQFAAHKNLYNGSLPDVALAVDIKNNIYALFNEYNEIQKYDNNGNLLLTWADTGSAEGNLFSAMAIAIGPDNNVYVADTNNRRIQVFSQLAQPVKVSIDRTKLSVPINRAKLDFYNDDNVTQPPISVEVLAYGSAKNNINRRPVLTPIPNKTVREGRLLQFTVTAIDFDRDALTYSASNLPQGASFDASKRTFAWRPTYDQAGVYKNIRFNVTDGKLTTSRNITITVRDVNHKPVITASCSPTYGRSPLRVRFRSKGTYDPDKDKLTYLWQFGDGRFSYAQNPVHTYRNPRYRGILRFFRRSVVYRAVLTVKDAKGVKSTRSFTIRVR